MSPDNRKRLVAHEPHPLCPVCGANRPFRSLLLCRRCWAKLPGYVQAEAQKAAKEDRKSIVVGNVAAKVISTASRLREP